MNCYLNKEGFLNKGYTFLVLFCLTLFFVVVVQAQPKLEIELDPKEIGIGDEAVLTVTVQGSATARPEIPEVEGLEFVSAGQSSQVQFINGQMSSSVSYRYRISANQVGDYTLGPVSVNVGRERISSEKIQLKVYRSSGSAGYLAPKRGASSNQQIPSNPSLSEGSGVKEQIQLKVSALKPQVYVGEMIPVEIALYIDSSLPPTSVNPPQFLNEAFTMHNLSKQPTQGRERCSSGVCHVMKWYAALSPVKEGRFAVGAAVETVVQVREKRTPHRRSTFGGSLFDRGFFEDDFFGDVFAQYREKQVTAKSETQEVEVLSLPEEGKPDSFRGAIGRFTIEADAAPVAVKVGEPITAEVVIKGMGNFDRVLAPRLKGDLGLKSYPPEEQFKGRDSVGFEGEKTFKIVLIPETSLVSEIFPFEFSYFDNAKKQYQTIRTAAIQVKVAPGELSEDGSNFKGSLQGGSQEERGDSGENKNEVAVRELTDIAPIEVELGKIRQSLEPTYLKGWYLPVILVLIVSSILNLLWFWWQKGLRVDRSVVEARRLSKIKEEMCKQMTTAIENSDSALFFASGRKLVQEYVGSWWGLAPESITVAEVRSRFGDNGHGLARILESADALAFGGTKPSDEEMKVYLQNVLADLNNLKIGA